MQTLLKPIITVWEKRDKTIGLIKGRLTTKIHICIDVLDNPIRFYLIGISVHKLRVFDALLDISISQMRLAGITYDTGHIAL